VKSVLYICGGFINVVSFVNDITRKIVYFQVAVSAVMCALVYIVYTAYCNRMHIKKEQEKCSSLFGQVDQC